MDYQPRAAREAALRRAENDVAARPEAVEPRFCRASLLAQLGRTDEAKAAYLDVLTRAPAHFGALNDFGNLLHAGGFRTAALRLYAEAARRHPGNPKGHVNLANLLAESGETAQAAAHFEAALRLAPDHVGAHRGLAYLLTELRQEERAAMHRERACRTEPVLTAPFRGIGTPIRLLQLVSAVGGSIPLRHHFDDQVFAVSSVFVEYFDPARPLPPHEIVFNAISDADLCGPALEAANALLANTDAPVINSPRKVMATGRAASAIRLGALPGVIAPHVASLPREALELPGAAGRLAERGLSFPLLLRAPGFHTGRHFLRVACAEDLPDAVRAIPGPEILAIQFLDARGPDGKTRKYRVMMIGGALYPLHAAVSHDWKIHYFTADMADHPGHRAEDAAFLEDMPQVLGPRATRALHEIALTLGLDYGGMDFSLSLSGDVLLWEANAGMVVYAPDADPRWDYRRPATARVLNAVRRLTTPPTLG